jgi:hypothetical protein
MRRSLAAITLFVTLLVASSADSAVRLPRWPASFERSFLVNCNATSHGMIAACRCELRSLERHFTFRHLATIFLHDQVRLRAIVTRAALACSS